MDYRKLGRSSLKISAIGFGCMSLVGTDEEAVHVIDQALESGINFFDTADLYEKGLNEERVGRLLKGRREQVVLATKVGNEWRPDGSGWDWNPSRAHIIRAVETSLQRLQTDRIDLYQLHGGTIGDPIEDIVDAFELLQREGKIIAYGISSIRPAVIREYTQRSAIASVMMQYSLLDRRPEENCLDLLLKAGIGVLVRGAVAKGLLVDKMPIAYLNYSAEDVKKAAAFIRAASVPKMGSLAMDSGFVGSPADESKIGSAGKSAQGTVYVYPAGSNSGTGRNAAQTAIGFVLAHPAVTSAVIGLRSISQVVEAAGTMEADGLTAAELSALRGAIPVNRYLEHR